MQEILINIFGSEYYKYFVIAISGLFEIFVTMACFMFNAKKNDYFWFKLILIFVCIPLLALPYSALLYADRSLNPFARSLINSPFILLFVCASLLILYKNRKHMFLLDYISVLSVALISGAFYSLLLNLSGQDSSSSFYIFGIINNNICWIIYWIIHILIDFLLGLLSKSRHEFNASSRTKTIVYIVSIIVIFGYSVGLGVITRFDKVAMQLAMYVKILIIAFYSIVLVIRSGLLYTSKKEQEILLINQSLRDNQQQFKNMRDSIDIINAKTHDLRHQLSKLGDKIANEDLAILKEATKIYDSTIKTNNPSLDAILYQTQLLAQKKDVKFSIIADGHLLDFLEDSELYFLLNNIFNNAFEAINNLPQDKKIITFKVYENLGMTVIEESNYCNSDVVIKNTVPIKSTSKDTSMIHGYGMKSINYLIQKHNGFISCKIENNIFRIVITFQNN